MYLEFDEDFYQIQNYVKQVNSNLVVLPQENVETEVELFEKMVLQIKIYGSKIIELYQSLDEICPTDRQLQAFIPQAKIESIDYDQVWLALNKGFVSDTYKAMDLMQQLDYKIKLNQSQQAKFIEFLQITCRLKDREIEKLSQLFPNQYPESYFKQIEQLNEMILQYSQMVPLLVQENETLRLEIENTKINDNDGKTNEISLLRQHLQNIEKQLTETQSQNEYYQQMIKAEEQVRQNRTQLQMLQIDNQDLLFKNNTLQEEIKNYQDQIRTQIESFDRMQMEYKKIIQKKNQQIQELEEKNNLDLTIKNNNQVDLDLIQQKIQQFKSLYEQKIKHLSGTITHLEQENAKLKDLVRSSALEVDSLRLQIEKIITTNNKKTLKIPKKSQQDYVQLYQKYQEVVEKNEQLSQQLYSQILDGSVLSHI
ncbi:unnamed protein product (macronuclear) [Paramecium tetraurelia]|uniref:Uncharacterized protein n=1 Tax=Paramecium tetraurelia TaxID=5888 RepID=A0CUJ2_PARTE|nr:uncharacterized protein GSPATT00010659001 [Paramecium tetraurelia]CAK74459.1 unnamed protein product [Paramecium tetraurelia]|eukprot:XP_001441856.1 hypothetical protein (macronuclear) [Paramecium tetraurelia strain d4-2]